MSARLKPTDSSMHEVLHAADDAAELYEQEKELEQIKRSIDKKFIVELKGYSNSATNSKKNIRMVVLNTKVIFFRENGGKLQLFSVDNKAPVLMLKNILVKEVSSDEKALFLVSTSREAALIYELVCESRSNRSDLAKKLQGYVKNSPDIEEDNTSEEEEVLV